MLYLVCVHHQILKVSQVVLLDLLKRSTFHELNRYQSGGLNERRKKCLEDTLN